MGEKPGYIIEDSRVACEVRVHRYIELSGRCESGLDLWRVFKRLWVWLALAAVLPSWAFAATGAEAAVLVNAITLQGNSEYSDAELRALYAKQLGIRLSLEQLRSIADRIQNFYKDHGFPLTRVIIPKQDFADGHPVIMVVLEGRLGVIDVKNAGRYRTERIRQFIHNAGLRTGRPIKFNDLRRAIALLNRQAGIQVSTKLREGNRQGYTDLVVDVHPQPLFAGSVELNNYGSSNTGRYRAMATLGMSNATGLGDQLNVLGLYSFSQGNAYFARMDYQLPINTHGTSVKAFASGGNIHVGSQLQELNIRGRSQGLGLGIAQDQVLSPQSILSYHAFLEGTDLRQKILGTVVSRDHVRKARIGASFTNQGLFSRTQLDFDVHLGLGEILGAMANNSPDSSRPGADNHFTKITVDMMRVQQLLPRLELIPSLDSQYAFNPLVTGEQYTIGGAYSIRGQAPAAYSGDSGYTATVELRYDVLSSGVLQAIGQISHGRVFVKNTSIAASSSHGLSGLDVGLRAEPINHLTLQADVGIPVGPQSGDSKYWYGEVGYGF